MATLDIKGNIVRILQREIFYGVIHIEDGLITAIERISEVAEGEKFILPGFIDSHVHVESSMLIPAQFARLAVVHGTTGTISDPHEIANVCGMAGVDFMIENGKTVPFKFHFGAPSCVPATAFETAGASLGIADVDQLLSRPEVRYLSEMMNFPGVLHNDPEVMGKITSAKKYGKPVDGHAPGLTGEDAKRYIDAGISTDHECFTAEEALGKLAYGMKILIREGSAAKNFDALVPLMHEHFENMMFCSDDKHPDSLELGHINQLCARAVAYGIDVFKVLQAACINPVLHYSMDNGMSEIGQPADLTAVKDLRTFQVTHTWINGNLVAAEGQSLIRSEGSAIINAFEAQPVYEKDFFLAAEGKSTIPVIEALDGQLITNRLDLPATSKDGNLVSNTSTDVLKIAVVNRYSPAPVAISFIKNIGLKHGAIASSVAHDSHNIVAVGTDDESLMRAVNLVIAERGGVSAVSGSAEMVLGLPVAGLMSNRDGYEVSRDYTAIDNFVKNELGSRLGAPFMTLSFMALLVIPHLKLSDKGLFDGDTFSFV